jgi:raffinose/stachyose/melibiose transport system permease protein
MEKAQARPAPSHKRQDSLWQRLKRSTLGIFLIAPILFVAIFVLYPLAQDFALSLTNWGGFTPPSTAPYIGLTNFRILLTADPVFLTALENNVIWVLIFLVANNAAGLALAGTIDMMKKRIGQFFRIVIYLSVILPSVVVAYLFLALYDPNIGLIDGALKAIGLTALAKTEWLGNPHLTLYSILFSSIWQYAGFPMLIFLAAFSSISPSLYEAAKIDGATEWSIFWKVKVPMIRPVIIMVLALTYIWNSMPFAQVWTMTQGGPGHASEVLVTYLYREAFSGFQFGYAAAISVILFLLIFPVVVIFVRSFEK